MRVVASDWDGDAAYIASLRDVTERKLAEQTQRRLIAEQAARRAAESSVRRLRFLLESSTALAASLDGGNTFAALGQVCVAEIADWAVVYTVDADGAPARAEVAHRDPAMAELAQRLRQLPVDGGPRPILDVVRDGDSHLFAERDDQLVARLTGAPDEQEVLTAIGVRSAMLVPLVARGRAIGAVAFFCTEEGRGFGAEDLALAEDVARRGALAVDNTRLYREAQKANQSKADFLAVVSHDLRTPLNAIVGYSELLDAGIPEPLQEGARDYVRRIRTSARHLIYLLNELLTFARLDAGGEPLHVARVDLCDVAREVAMVVDPLAVKKGLELTLELPDCPLFVNSDADKLRQVLLNIVSNAVKYTERGHVRVAISASDTGARVVVGDTGIGIAPDQVEQIFEPFWQADSSQRKRGAGTGLGLSVVRRMLDMLHGDVTVKSAPGAGSTFTVTIPRDSSVV
jgi:signal transduction histidine kinase